MTRDNREPEAGVAVTGIGAVTSLGVGADTLYQGWSAGRDVIHHGTATYDHFDPSEHLSRKEVRTTDRFTQFGLVAAQEAIAQARWLEQPVAAPERIGCVMSTVYGGLTTLEGEISEFESRGGARLSPVGVTRTMGNAVTASIAIKYGWHGESFSVLAACAGGAQAIGMGKRLLDAGVLDAVLVGGSDAMVTPYGVAAFDVMGTVSRTGICRPYDVRRDGFVPGEGAGVMTLERSSNARRRGVPSIARVAGYSATIDAHHLALPPTGGPELARAIGGAIRSAGLSSRDIDYVNPHGTSSPVGDRTETAALKTALGDEASLIPISSTKSAIGHLQAAGGAAEAVATLSTLSHGLAPANLRLEEQDPELGLNYIMKNPHELTDRSGKGYLAALTLSFGLGGHNCAVVLATDEAPSSNIPTRAAEETPARYEPEARSGA